MTIEVEDNGPGMSPEVQKRIFEPFFTTKPQGVGTGIGLSVCHGIVTAHDGRISVHSNPGQCTLFTVSLPLHRAENPAARRLRAASAPAAARGRVLVVDDDQEIGELVAEYLRQDGLEVVVVCSGRVALDRLRHERFDLVVSDLRMPDLDGTALIAALERDHPALARRVVLITGDALGAELSEVVRHTRLPVLEKPLDLAVLRRQVAKLLEGA